MGDGKGEVSTRNIVIIVVLRAFRHRVIYVFYSRSSFSRGLSNLSSCRVILPSAVYRGGWQMFLISAKALSAADKISLV